MYCSIICWYPIL